MKKLSILLILLAALFASNLSAEQKDLRHFMFIGEPTAIAWQFMIDNPGDRKAAVGEAFKALGGEVVSYYFGLGDGRNYITVTLPNDNELIQAVYLMRLPSGMLTSYQVIELMPSDQMTEALKRAKELIEGDSTVRRSRRLGGGQHLVYPRLSLAGRCLEIFSSVGCHRILERKGGYEMTGTERSLARLVITALLYLLVGSAGIAEEGEWEPIQGTDVLQEFMSGLVAERSSQVRELAKPSILPTAQAPCTPGARAFPRTWTVEGEIRVCITQELVRKNPTQCIELERNTSDPTLYRLRQLDTGKVIRFRADADRAVAEDPEEVSPSKGGAAAASASEIAAKLADPNAVIGTMTVNFDYIWHDGELPDASGQSSFTIGFQPSLPYPLAEGKNFFVRPNIPIIIDQAKPAADGGYESVGVELGDIGFDAAVGFTLEGGKVLVAGISGSFPTATDDKAGSDQCCSDRARLREDQ